MKPVVPNGVSPARFPWGIIWRHFWFKAFGTMGFTCLFFVAYLMLLKHPAAPVHLVPTTWLDHWIGFQPLALPIYLSLWFYVSLPPILMASRREIADYGARVLVPCLIGLIVFYLYPNAVPPVDIDWAGYPSVAFLKNVDSAGNACPSLHVATAVYSCCWLAWRLRGLGCAAGVRALNVLWCVAIAYSTMAVKQHVAWDVLAGTLLGLGSAWATGLKAHALHPLSLSSSFA